MQTDEIKEKGNHPVTTSPQVTLPLVSALSAGLLVSFWLPWVRFLGVGVTGAHMARIANEMKVLYLIPIAAALALIAGLSKTRERNAAQFAGITPWLAFIYIVAKEGTEIVNNLAAGGYLALGAGLLLVISPYLTRQRQPRS